ASGAARVMGQARERIGQVHALAAGVADALVALVERVRVAVDAADLGAMPVDRALELARRGERALRNALEGGVERAEVAIADLRVVLRGGVEQEAPDVETKLVEGGEELVLEERGQRSIGEERAFVDQRDRAE